MATDVSPREPGTEPGAKPAGKGGLGKKIGPFPTWVWIVGVGGVALYYLRARSAAAQRAAGVGTASDTLTAGAPIDSSGAPIGTTGTGASGLDIDQWRAAAFKALVNAGVAPSLAEQALSNFLNQNALGPQQSAAIDKALGLVGAPPVNLPFYGTVPSPHGPTKKPPPVPTGATHDPGFRVAPIASFPHVQLGPGEHIVDVIRTNTTGAGYYLSNLGGVFAVGGAPFLGSAFTKPHAAGTQFSKLVLNANGGYTLVADNGHTMTFAPKSKAA